MPQVLGNAGAMPPPGRNEVLLREAVDRLRLQLAEAKDEVDALDRIRNVLFAELRQVRAERDAAREVVETTRGHDCSTRWQGPCGHQFKALADYDTVTKAMGGS